MTEPYNNAPREKAPREDAPHADAPEAQPTSYSPPVEPRNTWAAAQGWPQQTPPHWFEPLPAANPVRRRRRRPGTQLALLFAVALIASALGSGATYMALSSGNQLRPGGVGALPSPTFFVAPSPSAAAASPGQGITSAVERVSPAVVTITVRAGEATDPFSLPETGVGSGVIYDAAGWVLTNRHVVEDATQVTVQLNDRSALTGTVYGVDTLTDLAIVKLDAADLPFAPIGDSSQVRPGQTAIVIGSPLGTFTNSVTSGIISALGREITVTDPVTNERRRLRNLIQTDAAINQGNSGGPLLDESGNVIGISTALSQGAQGIFFAIPINIAKPIMSQAIAGEPLTRPWIGIVYLAVDRNVAEANELPIDYGAWIAPETGSGDPPIVPDSPAADAGLLPGDIVTAIDAHRIDAAQGLDDVLSLYGPGDELTLAVLRDGVMIDVPVTLGTRPAGLD